MQALAAGDAAGTIDGAPGDAAAASERAAQLAAYCEKTGASEAQCQLAGDNVYIVLAVPPSPPAAFATHLEIAAPILGSLHAKCQSFSGRVVPKTPSAPCLARHLQQPHADRKVALKHSVSWGVDARHC